MCKYCSSIATGRDKLAVDLQHRPSNFVERALSIGTKEMSSVQRARRQLYIRTLKFEIPVPKDKENIILKRFDKK